MLRRPRLTQGCSAERMDGRYKIVLVARCLVLDGVYIGMLHVKVDTIFGWHTSYYLRPALLLWSCIFSVCACLLSGLNITEENEQLGYAVGYQKLEFGAQGLGKFQLNE